MVFLIYALGTHRPPCPALGRVPEAVSPAGSSWGPAQGAKLGVRSLKGQLFPRGACRGTILFHTVDPSVWGFPVMGEKRRRTGSNLRLSRAGGPPRPWTFTFKMGPFPGRVEKGLEVLGIVISPIA